MAERFASGSEDELCEKMSNKTIIEFGFRMISCSTSFNNCLVFNYIFKSNAKSTMFSMESTAKKETIFDVD